MDEPPAPGPESFERWDVAALLGQPTIDITGVTVDPSTGERFVLDAALGIIAVRADGAELVAPFTDMPVPDVPMQSSFTDLAALGDGRFALTALNNGYLWDLGAGTLRQYFCYLPDDMPMREEFTQLTLSVTFDVEGNRLFAQPQTMRTATGEVVESSVGEFSRDTGEDLRWFVISDRDFLAGGLAADSADTVLLGQDSAIYRYRFSTRELGQVVDLADAGVSRISGLAVDRVADAVLVLDGSSLLTIPGALVD